MKFLVVLACLVSVAVASGIIGHGAIVSGPVAVSGYGLGSTSSSIVSANFDS